MLSEIRQSEKAKKETPVSKDTYSVLTTPGALSRRTSPPDHVSRPVGAKEGAAARCYTEELDPPSYNSSLKT